MNISSVSATVPVKGPEASAPKAADVKTDEAGASHTAQPTVLAALPPGQGTRIDQFA